MSEPEWAKKKPTSPQESAPSSQSTVSDAAIDYFQKRMYSSDEIKSRVIGVYGEEGIGKTVLAAKLGTSNLFLTDDNGILSLKNHPELDSISVGIPFTGYSDAIRLIRACESQKLINPKTDTPFDNLVFDTVSGMLATEIRRSIENKEIKTEKGKLAENIPTLPHYLLSEQNFGPLMKEAAKMLHCSATFLAHMRTGTKDIPGASTRADMHGAAYKLMAKYCSVLGYYSIKDKARAIQVMPGAMVAAKTRLNFGRGILTDNEFVEKIKEWKA